VIRRWWMFAYACVITALAFASFGAALADDHWLARTLGNALIIIAVGFLAVVSFRLVCLRHH
jgi:hypothetical protein